MQQSEYKYILFYDGDCGVCNFWVQWVMNRDHMDLFAFASLQSDLAQKFLKDRNLETKNFNTIYLWKPNAYYLVKSKAILKVFSKLGMPYPILAFFLRIFPRIFSDAVYDSVARNRMKISNQKCFLPTENQKKKILY